MGSSNELECGRCQQKFKFRSSLYQHYSRTHYEMEMRIFVDEESNTCRFCGILIRDSKYMIAHIGSVHDKVEEFLPDQWKIEKKKMTEPEEGDGDENKIHEEESIEIWNKSQSQKKSLHCKICPSNTKDYGKRSTLFAHYSVQHYQDELVKFIDTKSKSCLICGKKMSKLKDLLIHVGCVHEKLEDFLLEEYKDEKCKFGNSKISNQENSILQPLKKKHLKKKTNTKDLVKNTKNGLQCKMCPKFGFYERSKLARHYACVHFKDKLLPFVDVKSLTCLICEKKRKGLCDLLLHVGNSHNKLKGLVPDEDNQLNGRGESYLAAEKSEDELLCPFCEDNCYFDS